jgi:hypothetical protein
LQWSSVRQYRRVLTRNSIDFLERRLNHQVQKGPGGFKMRVVLVCLLAALCSSCVTNETVRFQAKAQQEALVRDGVPALVSRQKNSLVLIRPASREFRDGARPVFVVGINNLARSPIEFRVANIEAQQVVNGQAAAMKVITYERLVQEERTRQVVAAVVTGVAAGANAMSAANAGRYNSTSTVHTSRGTYQVHTTGYSPTAAAIAQSNAAAENEAMIAATIERGRQNLAALEGGVIKDNTLLPGEWYGGQLHLQPLLSESSGSQKTYTVTLMIGSDRHEIDIVQGAPQ